ncbi:MAG: FoF1 ATP synthase subunit gamma, partial [Candidatus Uhrbacteria bacterium]|nr:FoF1 ATP synthase subunit gamma [Candidatus Uhrbacteria bacterium]
HPIGDLLYKEFMAGSIDRVFVGYTQFKSALTQIPTVFQLLPLIPEEELSKNQIEEDSHISYLVSQFSSLWEPSPNQVLDQLLPRAIEMTVYQSFLESAASEQSARMLAMKSAGDAASDMLDDLTFSLNQARQSSITREISEISAGKAAIE